MPKRPTTISRNARSRWTETGGHDAETAGHVGPKYPITGRITLILARAAEMSIRKGTETINAEWLELASRDLDLSPPLVA
jgi:hypothetical protein